MYNIRWLAIILVPLAVSQNAHAETFSRPNLISARAVGMGGAFVGVANDATALHFNPAGMALIGVDEFLVGAEVLIGQRKYENTAGESVSPGSWLAAPVLGWTTRLKKEDRPTRLTFGAGLWNTYGVLGSLDDSEALDGLNVTTFNDFNVEAVAGLAYRVNDVLAIGGTFRFAFGLFGVEARANGTTIDVEANGFGIGGAGGVMITPNKRVSLGVSYRSGIDIRTTGTGKVSALAEDVRVEFMQEIPQKLSAGGSFRLTDRFLLSTEFAWTNWQSNQSFLIDFQDNSRLLNNEIELDWNDGYQIKLGGEYAVTPALVVRAGTSFDSNISPDRTVELQWADMHKMTYNGGLSVAVTKRVRVDAGIEFLNGFERTVEDNSQEAFMAGWPERANAAPGKYQTQIGTFELALRMAY